MGPGVECRGDGDDDRNSMICTLNIIQVIKSCCMCGGEERCIHGFGRGNLRKGDHRRPRHRWEDILHESARSGMGSMHRIGLVQDRDSW